MLLNATACSALPNGRPEDGGQKLWSLAEMLPAHRSAFIGKWHLGGGNLSGHQPHDFGFESIAYQDEGWSGYSAAARAKWHLPGPATQAEYLTDALTELGSDWLRQHAQRQPGKPFLLYLSHFAVHSPWEAKPEDVAYFEQKPSRGWNGHANAAYAAMVRSFDHSVGTIRRTLDDLGLSTNTVLIVLSDNGGIERHGQDQVTCNAPLRGQKAQTWEGGIRVPCIISWPGQWPGGMACHRPISICDIAPTVMEMSRVSPSPAIAAQVTGRSLVPVLRQSVDAEPADPPVFIHEPYYRKVANTELPPSSVIIDGDYKLIAYHDGTRALYHLPSDPGEQRNLAGSQSDRSDQMFSRLAAWRFGGIPSRYDTALNPHHQSASATVPFVRQAEE
jgi:arylsulfatase A-like enzyme